MTSMTIKISEDERATHDVVPKPKRNALSKTPSRAIRQAVDDLKRVEKSKRYRVDMGSWHTPHVVETIEENGVHKEKSVCSVCLGGAVMARIVDNPMAFLHLSDFNVGDGTLRDQLNGLDYFRLGSIEKGLKCFGKDLPKFMAESVPVESYYIDPKGFKADLLEMADALEGFGL